MTLRRKMVVLVAACLAAVVMCAPSAWADDADPSSNFNALPANNFPSIGDVFDMQMKMNKLSQVSEMTSP